MIHEVMAVGIDCMEVLQGAKRQSHAALSCIMGRHPAFALSHSILIFDVVVKASFGTSLGRVFLGDNHAYSRSKSKLS